MRFVKTDINLSSGLLEFIVVTAGMADETFQFGLSFGLKRTFRQNTKSTCSGS